MKKQKMLKQRDGLPLTIIYSSQIKKKSGKSTFHQKLFDNYGTKLS